MRPIIQNKLLLTTLLSCVVLFASAQSSPGVQGEVNYVPTTPTMWEFNKYGDYPVSLSTGVPNINIPLYTAVSGELEVPVAINYHASGIKVDQKASWVGLGWNLTAGGAITRTVRGSADEGNRGYIKYPFYEEAEFNPAVDYYEMEEMLQGFVDTEPDEFQYNFLGYSGRFIFRHSTGTTNPVIQLIPHNDLKITPVFSGANIVSFTVVTPTGIVAEFAYPEASHDYRAAGLIGDYTVRANTVWHLKKLTASNKKDVMTFQYKLVPGLNAGSPGNKSNYHLNHSINIRYQPCSNNNYTITPTQRKSSNTSYSGVKRLDKIYFNNGYIHFVSSSGNRIDDPDDEDLRLDKVIVYSTYHSASEVLKTYEFDYGQFGSVSSASSFPAEDQVRLQLTKVSEVDSEGVKQRPYSFEYRDSGSEKLPPRYSYSQDYWGYYNGKGNSSIVPRLTYAFGNGRSSVLGGADRNPSANHVAAGLINKITYPTKGYTTFEFEPNSAVVNISGSIEQRNTGGVRIKNITSYVSDDSIAFQKSYEYLRTDDATQSSGKYNGRFPQPRDFLRGGAHYIIRNQNQGRVGNCGVPTGPTIYNYRNDFISSSSNVSLNNASTYYSAVKEYNGSVTDHQGYTIYRYATRGDTFFQGSGPVSLFVDRGWDRGQLLREDTYELGSATPVRSVVNSYETVSAAERVRGYKPGTRFSVESIGFPDLPGVDGVSWRGNQYFLTYYHEPISWKRLTSTTTTQDGVETEVRYNYHVDLAHTNATFTRTYGSTNGEVGPVYTSLIRYAHEESNTALLNQNMVGIPLEVKNYVGTELTGGDKVVYDDFNTGSTPLLMPAEFIEITQSGTEVSNSEVLQVDVISGNPLEIASRNGLTTRLVWGYDNERVVIRVVNPPTRFLLSVSGALPTGYSSLESLVKSLSNIASNTAQQTRWKNFNTALRSNTANTEAHIYTYTYDPLIGITSETDPNGIISYYRYDELNRLTQIVDWEGNVLQQYDYHYSH